MTISKGSEIECKIIVNVLENNDCEESRTAEIDITYDTITERCTIIQTSDSPKIILSKEEETCSYEEKSYDFTYSIENPRESFSVQVSCSSSWITDLSDNDGKVSFKVTENNSGDDRSAEILITYGSISAKYTVKQEYTAPSVSLYPDTESFDYNAAQGIINYKVSNHHLGMKMSISCDADWITDLSRNGDNKSGKISFNISENNDSEPVRTAYIEVSYGPVRVSQRITQSGGIPTIILSDGGRSCEYKENKYSFTYRIENPRESLTPKVSCSSNWIKNITDNNGTVSFYVTENNSGDERTAEILVTYGDYSAKYIVQQKYTAPRIFLYTDNDKDVYDYHAARGCISYHIDNCRKELKMHVSCDAKWITDLEYEDNKEDGSIFFNIKENNDNEESRSAYIYVTYGLVTEGYEITQTSDAPKIVLNEGGRNFGYDATSFSFTYRIENPRESLTPRVTCSSDWIKNIADNNGTVSFYITENNSGYERTDEILITYGNYSARFFVQQKYTAPYIFLYTDNDKDIYDYHAARGCISYHIDNCRKELKMHVSCDAKWITDLEYEDNKEDGNIFFNIKENNDSEPSRTACFYVTYGTETQRYDITQTSDAPKIVLTNGGHSFNYSESTHSFTYSIQNPRESLKSEVTCTESWISSLKDNNGTVSFNVLENNSGSTRSGEICIRYGSAIEKYYVEQKYNAPLISLFADKNEFNYKAAQGSIIYHIDNSRKGMKVNVSCNADWVTILDCTGNEEEGKINFSIKENNKASRSTQIVVSYGDVTSSIDIIQTYDTPKISLRNGGQVYNYEGKTYSFTYNIENPRESLKPTVSCNTSWITKLVANDGIVSFYLQENNSGSSRSDEILITYGGASIKYYVEQTYEAPGIYLEANKDTFNYSEAEGSVFYHIDRSRKDLKITVSTDANWITILDRIGNDEEGNVYFRVNENNDSESYRYANIYLAVGDIYTSCQIVQTSDAPKITMVNGGQTASYKEESYSFNYTIENPRPSLKPEVTCEEKWIIGLQDNNGSVSFTVKENNDEYERTAPIRIAYGNTIAYYYVQQEYVAPEIFLQADKDIFNYKAAESSVFYHINNSRKDLKIVASTDADWVTILDRNGNNEEGKIYFRINENNDRETSRYANIYLAVGDRYTSCQIVQTSDAPKITMVNGGQSASYKEESYSFNYTIENPRPSLKPEVTCEEKWIIGLQDNNGSVSFTVKENNDEYERTAPIRIAYGNTIAYYYVQQEYVAPEIFLQADKDIFNYKAAESSVFYHINNSRKDLKIVASTDADWVTILDRNGNNEEGKIYFRINENNDRETSRYANIYLAVGDRYTSCQIVQTSDAPKITMVNGGQSSSYEEKSYSFTYNIENPRESLKPIVRCSSSWITELADDNGRVSFTLLENNSGSDRSDEIQITYGNISASYYIQQRYLAPEIFLEANKTEFNYKAAQGSIFYHINNCRKNIKPSISCDAEWLTITNRDGSDEEGMIYFSIKENNGNEASRSASIFVTYGDLAQTWINITQTSDTPKITMINGGQSCNYAENTYNFSYNIENPRETLSLSAYSNTSWINILSVGNGYVSFKVHENNDGHERTGEIILSYGNFSTSYIVQQKYQAPYVFLYAEKDIYNYHNAQGSISYHIDNSRKNMKIYASCNADWITDIECNGNQEDGKIYFNIKENNDNETSRSTNIYVSYGDVTTGYYITQTNDLPKITMTNGGNSYDYTENTYSFTYGIENPRESMTPTVSTYASWIKGLTINNGVVTFTLEENNTMDTRGDEIKITYGNITASYYVQQTYSGPTIFLNTNTSDFNYKAGTGRITYYIDNARKNIKMQLSCEASWVTNIRYNGDGVSGEILFDVNENYSSQDRSTYINVNYVMTSETIHIYQTHR